MGDPSTFQFAGLTFNITNIISVTVALVIVFLVVFFASRKITLKPSRGQNFLEWLIDFTNGVVKGSIPGKEANAYGLYAFTLFLFLFISNEMGMILHISTSSADLVRSPTSDPVVTMTMSLMTVMIAQFAGVRKLGYKAHFNNYLKPFVFWLPLSIFEELTNFLTLGLRIFGVILSGEMLLSMLTKLAFSHGIVTMALALPIQIVWQGFSLFLGAIQAYVFITLTSVYISRKTEIEE